MTNQLRMLDHTCTEIQETHNTLAILTVASSFAEAYLIPATSTLSAHVPFMPRELMGNSADKLNINGTEQLATGFS